MKADLRIRVLVVGKADEVSLEASYRRALKAAGCDVVPFDLGMAVNRQTRFGGLGQTLNRFLPVEPWVRKANRKLIIQGIESGVHGVVVIGSQEVRVGALAQLKVATGASLALVWPDTMLNLADSLVACLPAFDVVACYSRESIPLLERFGARRVVWLPLAGDPEMHAPVAVTDEERAAYGADVTFIGGWRPEREKVLRSLTGTRLKIWGPDWDRECPDKDLVRRFWQGRALRGVEFAKAVAASKINLNVIDLTNRPAANMRFFELPMCGGLQLVTCCAEMAGEYLHGEHLLFFGDQEDPYAVLRPFLSDERARISMAAAGHRLTRERHTYEHRAAALLAEMGLG